MSGDASEISTLVIRQLLRKFPVDSFPAWNFQLFDEDFFVFLIKGWWWYEFCVVELKQRRVDGMQNLQIELVLVTAQ